MDELERITYERDAYHRALEGLLRAIEGTDMTLSKAASRAVLRDPLHTLKAETERDACEQEIRKLESEGKDVVLADVVAQVAKDLSLDCW